MSKNINVILDLAIKELESILIATNWQDGYNFGQSNFMREFTKPLFFMNHTPPLGKAAEVRLENMTRTVYLLYSIIGANNYTACDKTRSGKVSFMLTIYSDDEFIFANNGKNAFAKYLNDLLDELERRKWAYALDGAQVIESYDNSNDFNFRTTYILDKIF